MPEPTTETTPTAPVVTPPVTTEQGTVGATTPAPFKISMGQTTPVTQPQTTIPAVQPAKLPPEEVQKRIDRMYARLQEERKQRIAAEAQIRTAPKPPATEEEDEDGGTTPPVPTLTEADVEAVLDRKEREKKFVDSEIHVFEQHPDALNEDGSFNMSSPFVQKYIEVGRRNPMLAMMENGPEMAAAMADKEMGSDFKKGRVAEATRLGTQAVNTFTTSSTTAVPPNVPVVQLTDVQKKIAKRMGISETEYIVNQGSNQVKQKSWEVKR